MGVIKYVNKKLLLECVVEINVWLNLITIYKLVSKWRLNLIFVYLTSYCRKYNDSNGMEEYNIIYIVMSSSGTILFRTMLICSSEQCYHFEPFECKNYLSSISNMVLNTHHPLPVIPSANLNISLHASVNADHSWFIFPRFHAWW